MAKGRKGNKELYILLLEMHNKIADCLNHLAAEKESLEDAADALARVRRMRDQMGEMLSAAVSESGVPYDSARKLKELKGAIDGLDTMIDEFDRKSKEMLGAAGDLARTWNGLEAEINVILERIESKPHGGEPYIR
ncbi:MAG: hypothetical protein KGH59_03890 [Candidatus Micrarchaeota archaeon]|nr:hypothetical protein [Candidatus Micrarchaeota archaeon]MDE1804894.1 hypothetical protein [Candidatus Micrarchaeota archaeon]MDE1846655.1 hypothetical protein [Candidatus Micrarchaeota archaeon]